MSSLACGLTFVAFVLSLFMLVRSAPHLRSRLCSGFTLAMSILAAVVTTVVFLIDVIFVAVVRNKIKNSTDGDVTATWGVGVSFSLQKNCEIWIPMNVNSLQTWLALAAAVVTWLCCLGACCGIFACGSRRK